MKLTAEQLKPLVAERAAAENLPLGLVLAICAVESANDTVAIRYEPRYRWLYCPVEARPSAHPKALPGCSTDTEAAQQRTSWGLMQIMGAVAREYGCREPFLSILVLPEQGLKYGCRHLARLAKRFWARHGWDGVICAYNAGTPRWDAEHKRWENQRYLDKVKARWDD